MEKKVISYFNKELKFYEFLKVIENQADRDIIGSCKRYLGMCPIKEAMSCMGKVIYIVGIFDDEDFKAPIQSYGEPVLVVDCDDILNSRFPELYKDGKEFINPGEDINS